MSVFFYFKSDETSKSFYDSSYNFMKEASITLGRIEERFGEKLNNISEKMSHFKDASKKIDEEEAEKYHMIDSLIDKAGLGEKERAEYTQKLIEKDLMIRSLDRQRMIAIQEAENLRKRASPWEESENRTNLDNIYTRKSQTIRAYLKTKIAQKVIICYTRAYLKTKIAQKVIICYTKNR